eukprot:10820865-Lingulodinium_polyedra.AAC.1
MCIRDSGNHFDRSIVIQRLAGAVQAWLGGTLPGRAGHPSLAEIEAGYQELRRALGTGLRTMAWAVPQDVLEAAQHDWAQSGGPAVLRRRLQERP